MLLLRFCETQFALLITCLPFRVINIKSCLGAMTVKAFATTAALSALSLSFYVSLLRLDDF